MSSKNSIRLHLSNEYLSTFKTQSEEIIQLEREIDELDNENDKVKENLFHKPKTNEQLYKEIVSKAVKEDKKIPRKEDVLKTFEIKNIHVEDVRD